MRSPQPAGQVDQRLALVLRRVLLGVAVQDRPLGLAGLGQRHLVGVLGPDSSQAITPSSPSQIGAGEPSPRMARSTASMATLPAQRRCERLPAGDQTLAGLPGGRRQVQRLTDRRVDDLLVQAKHRAQTGGHRRPQVRDVVDLVLVQADSLDQIDLDFVCGCQAADQVGSADTPRCWATATSGGMLSPGWEYSAARNVSWKSNSRTATPLAQAAHSGE